MQPPENESDLWVYEDQEVTISGEESGSGWTVWVKRPTVCEATTGAPLAQPAPDASDDAAAALGALALFSRRGITQALPLPHVWDDTIKFRVRWDGTFEMLQQPVSEDDLAASELALWDRHARQIWLALVEAWLPSASNFPTPSGRSQVCVRAAGRTRLRRPANVLRLAGRGRLCDPARRVFIARRRQLRHPDRGDPGRRQPGDAAGPGKAARVGGVSQHVATHNGRHCVGALQLRVACASGHPAPLPLTRTGPSVGSADTG